MKVVISCKSDVALITIYHICYGKNSKFFCCNLVDSSILKFISSFSHTKWLWLLLTEHGKEIDSGLNFVVWTCTRGKRNGNRTEICWRWFSILWQNSISYNRTWLFLLLGKWTRCFTWVLLLVTDNYSLSLSFNIDNQKDLLKKKRRKTTLFKQVH